MFCLLLFVQKLENKKADFVIFVQKRTRIASKKKD